MSRRAAGWALALLCGVPMAVLAQGPLTQLKLQGAGSQTGTGAFRCGPGEEGQMSLTGQDSTLSDIPLEPWAPEAISTDEKVIVATVAEHSAYVVNVKCVADGEAWITVKGGDAEVHMAALVGKARRKPTPKWTGSASPARAAELGAPMTRATTPVAATSPATIAPANATTGVATPGGGSAPQLSSGAAAPSEPLLGKRPTGLVVPDAPAVAATGLTLIAGYDRSVILRWRPAPGAAGYRVARKDVAANTLVTVTGDAVTADGQGLITDTVFVDRWLETGKTYAYYLATYFRRADGSYYFPDRASEQHGLATPRDPRTLGWLPAGWADPVSLARATIADGLLTVAWHPKFAAQRYAFGSVLVTSPGSAGSCASSDQHIFDFSVPDTVYTKNIPDEISGGGRVNTYCFTIRAKYPDEGGSVRLGSHLLYVPVGRDCPSDRRQPCGPWRVLPVESIAENQPGKLVRLVDEEP